jgi:2-succinyl-6-hydroxy-2,4-cyclohexadiene-1-carboxylate synthase
MSYCEVNELHYYLTSTGQGQPLVLLHGFTGNSEIWQPFIDALARNYRVITVDLPGHGLTQVTGDASRYQMAQIAADLESLLKRLAAVPAHWLGYSMGGRLALYIAAMKPHLVSSLILESASPGLATLADRYRRRLSDEALADRIIAIGVPAFVDEWEKSPIFSTQERLPDDVRSTLRTQRLKNSATGLANSLRGMGTGTQPSLWAELININSKVLLLAGEHDQKFIGINRRMVAKIPDATLTIIPGAGHTIHLEQPDQYISTILEFLELKSKERQDLSGTEQQYKYQGHQRHLLEPGV